MPGVGPAPRANRSRSQKPVRGDWVQLEPLDHPILPDLDEIPLPDICESWPYTARKYWDSWRESPVTARWADDDVAFAIDTISQFAATTLMKKGTGGVPLAASEMRLRMESLGLTPEGRRKSRLLLPEEEEPDTDDSGDNHNRSGQEEGRKLPEAI